MYYTKWDKKTIVTPCLFSENLCKELLELKERNNGEKDHDATDNCGNKYEIKATSSSKGTTTYNPKSTVKYLIWMFFDYANEEIVIKQIDYKKLKSEIQSKKLESRKSEDDTSEISININDFENIKTRKTITLGNIEENQWECVKYYCMRSLKELKK